MSKGKKERLYNGIELPEIWPPEKYPYHAAPDGKKFYQDTPPYLVTPPEVIDVTIGRQLFVDDFLVEKTDLEFTPHKPVKYSGNPVFHAEKPWEKQDLPCACPKSGGIWYDKKDRVWKMWYEAGWLNQIAYAESADGIHWERKNQDLVPGTNLILPFQKVEERETQCKYRGPSYLRADSTSFFIDDTDLPERRFKMVLRNPGWDFPSILMTSADGIHWENAHESGRTGDRSTMFYNPFRKKWCSAIRTYWSYEEAGLPKQENTTPAHRTRAYVESSDFFGAAQWEGRAEDHKWMETDSLDLPSEEPFCNHVMPELYNTDVVAYESIMLGMFQILRGPQNDVCMREARPKITELIAMYSRDGYHFSRPDRTSFIGADFTNGSWDHGYVQSVTNFCHVCGDKLRIYYTAFSGDSSKKEDHGMRNGMYSGGALGMAELRRDGFVSRRAPACGGSLTTRLLTVKQPGPLYVNVSGVFRVELLSEDGRILASCAEIQTDSTSFEIPWSFDCAQLEGKSFRLRFTMKQGDLYSFWFAKDDKGGSGGFIQTQE